MSQLDGVEVNGDEEHRYAGNMNLSFAYVEGESLIMGLKVSSGAPVPRVSLIMRSKVPSMGHNSVWDTEGQVACEMA